MGRAGIQVLWRLRGYSQEAEAWERLIQIETDDGVSDPGKQRCACCGEVWRYVGFFWKPWGYIHEFQHAHLPGYSHDATGPCFKWVTIEHEGGE